MSDLTGDPQYGDQWVWRETGELLVFLGPIVAVTYPDDTSFNVTVKDCRDSFHYARSKLHLPLGDRGNVLLSRSTDRSLVGVTVDYFNEHFEAAPK